MMKITICGSAHFVEKMRELKESLAEKGHDVIMPYSIIKYNLKNPDEAQKLKDSEEYLNGGVKADLTRKHFDEIKGSDAILVVNQEKNGISNYIGGATFAEMLFAFYLGKKIFMLNPVPDHEKLSMLRDEIEAVKPLVINGNLEEIA